MRNTNNSKTTTESEDTMENAVMREKKIENRRGRAKNIEYKI